MSWSSRFCVRLSSARFGAVFGRDVDGGAGILCSTNKAVNDAMLRLLPGQVPQYRERRICSSAGFNKHCVVRIFATASPGPEIGAVVMLLRNIDLEGRLSNGTRLRVVALLEHVADCEVLTGAHRGTRYLIACVPITIRDTALTRPIARLQFPLRVAYAMTINESQRQTFAKVGFYLNKPCFTHGQLYVVCFKVSRIQDLTVYKEPGTCQGSLSPNAEDMFTPNLVYSTIVDRLGVSREGRGAYLQRSAVRLAAA